jgi:threonine/homoserine/homoserine lactone efflux protein
MAYLAALAVSQGRRAGLAAVAGVALGLAVLGLMAAAGLQALILASPWLYQTIRTIGFLYLLWIAWETWQPPNAGTGEDEDFESFQKGFLTNLLNPKAGVFYISVLPAFIDSNGASVAIQSAILALLYVMVATLIHTMIVLFADKAGRSLTSQSRIIAIRRFLALALVGVALWFFVKT